MKDILLNENWDMDISAQTGDISLVESPMQEIQVRLLWFAKEWIFNESLGFPYFEYVFIKNPDLAYIKSLMKAEILSVEHVLSVPDLTIDVDRRTRKATVWFTVKTDEGVYRKEVELRE